MSGSHLRRKLLAGTISGTGTAFDLISEVAAIPGVRWSHASGIGLRGSIGGAAAPRSGNPSGTIGRPGARRPYRRSIRLSHRGDPSVPSAEDAVPRRSIPERWRRSVLHRGELGLQLGVDAQRRESPMLNAADHRVLRPGHRGLVGCRDDSGRHSGTGGASVAPWGFGLGPSREQHLRGRHLASAPVYGNVSHQAALVVPPFSSSSTRRDQQLPVLREPIRQLPAAGQARRRGGAPTLKRSRAPRRDNPSLSLVRAVSKRAAAPRAARIRPARASTGRWAARRPRAWRRSGCRGSRAAAWGWPQRADRWGRRPGGRADCSRWASAEDQGSGPEERVEAVQQRDPALQGLSEANAGRLPVVRQRELVRGGGVRRLAEGLETHRQD